MSGENITPPAEPLATIFAGWIYDHLSPHAAALKVAHPLMLRAIAGPHYHE